MADAAETAAALRATCDEAEERFPSVLDEGRYPQKYLLRRLILQARKAADLLDRLAKAEQAISDARDDQGELAARYYLDRERDYEVMCDRLAAAEKVCEAVAKDPDAANALSPSDYTLVIAWEALRDG